MALTKVTAGVIAANAVVDSFGSQSITGDKIGLNAITGNTLASNIINANNIVNSSITSAKIVSVANTQITGNIISSQIVPDPVFNGNTTVTNIIVGAGSNTAPSISSIGIANTGIFFPAANNIGFATNGITRGTWTTDGLCFGSDTTAANALDDYEEGTWTATVAFGGASVGIVYGNRTGNYTKIGNLVVCTLLIQVTNVGSSSGAATITGLPFSSLSFGAINFGQVLSMSFADVPFGYTDGTTIFLQETTNAGGLTNLDNTNFTSSTQLIFNAVFRV